jgi:uncharacterized repeat protein (TIGR01451 family)
MHFFLRTMSFFLLSLLLSVASAQDSPLQVELEAFLVTEVTTESGDSAERFSLAQEVFPGNTLEYRLNLTHIGENTLPAGVSVRGPIPDNTQYLADSASQNGLAALTFSIDGGETFEAAPITRTETDENGNDVVVTVPPSEYDVARWTLNDPLEPGQVLTFIYRVEVQ